MIFSKIAIEINLEPSHGNAPESGEILLLSKIDNCSLRTEGNFVSTCHVDPVVPCIDSCAFVKYVSYTLNLSLFKINESKRASLA